MEEKKTYPIDFTDKELREEIIEYSEKSFKVTQQYGHAGAIRNNAYTGLAQLGIAELMRRENKSSQKTSKLFSGIAAFLTVVAITVSTASVWYNYKDNISDEEWETKQIELLEKINKNVKYSAEKTDSVWQNKNIELLEKLNKKKATQK